MCVLWPLILKLKSSKGRILVARLELFALCSVLLPGGFSWASRDCPTSHRDKRSCSTPPKGIMDHLWNPTDYAWDPEKLVAVREPSGPTSHSAKDKLPKSSSKRRGKNAPVLICQIEGCTTRLDSPYYRVCESECPPFVMFTHTVPSRYGAQFLRQYLFRCLLQKYRVCPNHAKSPAVVILGKTVRFCQKVCLPEFTTRVPLRLAI